MEAQTIQDTVVLLGPGELVTNCAFVGCKIYADGATFEHCCLFGCYVKGTVTFERCQIGPSIPAYGQEAVWAAANHRH